MKLILETAGKRYTFDQSNFIDISLRLNFTGDQVSAFGVPRASSKPYLAGKQPLDTREGAGCNCEEYSLITHCHVTHTECVGHITQERINVLDVLGDTLVPCSLITVQPQPAGKCSDTYDPVAEGTDLLITRESIERQISDKPEELLRALLIRTLPNDESKRTRDYASEPGCFLSLEAARFLGGSAVNHLLIDLPSVDRMYDEGKLNGHHLFWEVPGGSNSLRGTQPSSRTITEFVFVPDDVADGLYLLNLQVASIAGDAAPARPLLFPLIPLDEGHSV